MATTLPPSFGLQQPEDSMEISSEYGNMDADIDIDLDAPDANMQSFQDDHQMQEDPKSDRQDDDVMIDDSNLDDTDRMMQDDAPQQSHQQDEELLDFSEDEEDIPMNPVEQSQPEPQPETLEQPQPDLSTNQQPSVEEPVEQVQSDLASELLTKGVRPIDNATRQQDEAQTQPQVDVYEAVADETTADPQPKSPTQEQHNQEAQPEPQPEARTETHAPQSAESAEKIETPAQENVVGTTDPVNSNDKDSAAPVEQSLNDDQHEQQGNEEIDAGAVQQEDEHSVQPTLTRQETDLSNYTLPEDLSRERQRNSPTVTGLHPTIVEYNGNEVYLFPSKEPAKPEMYLLQNENLVTTSLGDLLQACRTALGEGISEDEELVLGVEELDLYVSEDSTPAFSTSFSELLDIFLQLNRLDGNDSPPPFRVSLTTKTRFTNRLSSITQAISEGKGFSQLPFLQYYEYDEPTELPDDDFDDEFDEDVSKLEQSQQLIEADAEQVDGTQTAVEHDDVAQSPSASKDNDAPAGQIDPLQATDSQKGEYEGEASAEHEDAAGETADQSEYHQEETQYFDAQGDASELVGEDRAGEQEHHETTAEAVHDNYAGAEAGEETLYHETQDDEAAQNEDASEHVDQEEYYEEELGDDQAHQQQDDQGQTDQEEEPLFGQGEFFDEDGYEYQDGEAPQEDDAHTGERAGDETSSHQAGIADEPAEAEEQQPAGLILVEPSEETAEANLSESTRVEAEDAEQDGTGVDAHVSEVAPTAVDDGTSLDKVGGEDVEDSHTTAEAEDDYDEINFDDEDGYEDQGVGLAPVTTNTSSKTSPGGKRSFAELDEADDEQDSKKARAS